MNNLLVSSRTCSVFMLGTSLTLLIFLKFCVLFLVIYVYFIKKTGWYVVCDWGILASWIYQLINSMFNGKNCSIIRSFSSFILYCPLNLAPNVLSSSL